MVCVNNMKRSARNFARTLKRRNNALVAVILLEIADLLEPGVIRISIAGLVHVVTDVTGFLDVVVDGAICSLQGHDRARLMNGFIDPDVEFVEFAPLRCPCPADRRRLVFVWLNEMTDVAVRLGFQEGAVGALLEVARIITPRPSHVEGDRDGAEDEWDTFLVCD